MHVVDETGCLLPDASIKIWATMLVPAGPDEETWHLHVAAQLAWAAMESGADGVTLDRISFNRLYQAGQKAVQADEVRRTIDGEQAGDVLITLRFLDRNRPQIASRATARRAHTNDMKRFDTPSLRRQESHLRASNGTFEPVAPLWAAYRHLARSTTHGVGAPVDWALLLALSEQYRKWAEQHHSPMGRMGTGRAVEPTLKPGTAWRPPEHAVLPHEEAARLDRFVEGRRFAELIDK